jgi:hypothetical protein
MFWNWFKKKDKQPTSGYSVNLKLSQEGLRSFQEIHARVEAVYNKEVDMVRTWDTIISGGMLALNARLDKIQPPDTKKPKGLRVVRNDDLK